MTEESAVSKSIKPAPNILTETTAAQRYGVALYTLLYKEINRFLRIWVQTLLPPAITMALYFVIFGHLIGSRIGEVGGFDYMQYIVPGLVMMSVITNAYANVSSSFFSAKFQRSVEELLVSPMPSWIIVIGYVAGGIARGLAVGIIVLCMSLFFTKLSVAHPFIMFVTLILTAAVFSLGGFINAMYANKFDDISIIPTFVLTPLTYLGGVFYSITMLPDFWQTASLANPIVYMVGSFRYGILGVEEVPLTLSLILLSGLTIGLFVLALTLFTKGKGIRS
ncbi:MAG: ABC transporter permease [Pseudomonadota bacterium]